MMLRPFGLLLTKEIWLFVCPPWAYIKCVVRLKLDNYVFISYICNNTCLLINVKWAISMRWWWCTIYTNRLSWILIVLAYWINNVRSTSIHLQMLVVFVFFIFYNYLFSRFLLSVVRSATISAEKRDGRSVFTSGWFVRGSLINCYLTSSGRYFMHIQNEVSG
jgi:hypothetical protein